MSTATANRPKKSSDLTRMPWNDLLEAFTRTGNDYGRKEQLHLEMRARVAKGYQRESYCPARLW